MRHENTHTPEMSPPETERMPILPQDLVRLLQHFDSPILKPSNLVAVVEKEISRMASDNNRGSSCTQFPNPCTRSRLKLSIARANHFIKQKDLRVLRGSDAEGQSKSHATRVRSHRVFKPVAKAGKAGSGRYCVSTHRLGNLPKDCKSMQVLPTGKCVKDTARKAQQRDAVAFDANGSELRWENAR